MASSSLSDLHPISTISWRAMITARVTEEKLDAHALAASIKNDQSGAVVLFSGDVRDNDHGLAVKALTYEIHPSAQSVIEEIVERIAKKHDLVSAVAVHRYGSIPIGESAFVVVVASKHRKAALYINVSSLARGAKSSVRY